jgi:hypothetical protein
VVPKNRNLFESTKFVKNMYLGVFGVADHESALHFDISAHWSELWPHNAQIWPYQKLIDGQWNKIVPRVILGADHEYNIYFIIFFHFDRVMAMQSNCGHKLWSYLNLLSRYGKMNFIFVISA